MLHTQTPAATVAIIEPVCPKCGTIRKSGKISCCGFGGSWFKKCGGTGDQKLEHTWFEGIQACKARSRSDIVIGQHLKAARQNANESLYYAGTVMASEEVTVPVNMPTTASIATSGRASKDNILTGMVTTTPSSTSASRSIAARGDKGLNIIAQISLLVVILL